MAEKVGEIFVNLDANTKDFDSNLDRAERKASTFGDRVASSFKSATSGSFMLLGGLTALAIGAGVAGTAALKNASSVENLRTSLDILTGSAERGGKMFKDIYDFAAKTPFETGELTDAASTMLQFGIANEKIMPNLRMLGDISLGNKDKLKGLSLAFSQVQSTGRLMGQDLLQMINNGFNPLSIISQKTGKSMATLKGEMEKGAISADMVRDAMVTATEKGGLFYNGMEKGSKTLSGIWSTLMDTAGTLTRKMVGLSETGEVIKGGLVDKVKNAINDLTTYMNNNSGAITKWVEGFTKKVQDNFPIITGAILFGLLPAFVALGGAIWTAMAPLLPFMAAGAILGGLLQVLADKMGGWGKMFDAVKESAKQLWDFLSPIFMPILQTIKDEFVLLIDQLKQFWEQNKNWLLPVLKDLGIILGIVIVAAIGIVLGAILLLVEGFRMIVSFAQWTGQNVAQIWEGMKAGAKGMGTFISQIATGISSSFKAAFNLVASAWNSTVGKISFTIPNWVPAMGGKTWSVPKIPYFAEGVENFAGGLAIVGERGPELVNLPKGSDVIPNDKIGTTNTFTGNIYLENEGAVNAFFDKLSRNGELARKGLATI